MSTTALTIARFIVRSSETPVSNLKLQKLLYYIQGWNLGLRGEPVFMEPIQAWIHGPVVPAVFREYRDFKWTPVADSPGPIELKVAVKNHINAVLGAYGKFAASQLEALSHGESPWIDARQGIAPNEPSTNVITHESMRKYFRSLANA